MSGGIFNLQLLDATKCSGAIFQAGYISHDPLVLRSAAVFFLKVSNFAKGWIDNSKI